MDHEKLVKKLEAIIDLKSNHISAERVKDYIEPHLIDTPLLKYLSEQLVAAEAAVFPEVRQLPAEVQLKYYKLLNVYRNLVFVAGILTARESDADLSAKL